MPRESKNFIFLLQLCLLFPVFLQGQIRIASPYSRYGVGDINNNNNAWSSSMGDISIGMRSSGHILVGNPASLTAIDSMSFVFEGGVLMNSVQLKSNLQQENRNYASVGYLLFGFPVTRWWRTSLGLMPYSDVGYNVANIENIKDIGPVSLLYTGEGGINRVNWGNGFRILRNLSIGVNISYLFGTMDRKSTALFVDSSYFAQMKLDNYLSLNDFYLTFGIQYHGTIKNDVRYTIGAMFGPETKIRAKTDLIAQTFFLGSSGTEFPKDTLFTAQGYAGRIVIPATFGVGLSFEKQDKWVIGADYKWQNWENFNAFGISDSLVNSYQISVGGEILPNTNAYTNYFKRIRYRLGFYYSSTYLDLRGKHLNEYAVTLGFGLPLKITRSQLNLGAQVGTRGTTDEGLIKETFFKFMIGFSINERWFVKHKYQ